VSSNPHDHGIHGNPEERDPPTSSPALVMALGTVIFLLICFFLIGIERSWHESMVHEMDAEAKDVSASPSALSRRRQEAQLQAGVHDFPKGDPNEALSGKRHISIADAMAATIQKYGKR
jgi:hypothetical protein